MWAPSTGSGGFLAPEQDEGPLAAIMAKHVSKVVANDQTSKAARRLQNLEKTVHEEKLALRREENSENRTEKTVRFLAAQLKTARKNLQQKRKDLAKRKNKTRAAKSHKA